MNRPDVGLWRAWLDGEAPESAPPLAEHLAACPACQRCTDALRQAAGHAAAAVAALAPGSVPSPASLALRARAAARRAGEPAVRPDTIGGSHHDRCQPSRALARRRRPAWPPRWR